MSKIHYSLLSHSTRLLLTHVAEGGLAKVGAQKFYSTWIASSRIRINPLPTFFSNTELKEMPKFQKTYMLYFNYH